MNLSRPTPLLAVLLATLTPCVSQATELPQTGMAYNKDAGANREVTISQGRALVYDIDIGEWNDIRANGYASPEAVPEARTPAQEAAADSRYWSNATVPYQINASITEDGQNAIKQAMALFKRQTGINFVARTTEPDYLTFIADTAQCSSRLGKTGGEQPVRVTGACLNTPSSLLHLLGHSIGLSHTSRQAGRAASIAEHKAYLSSPPASGMSPTLDMAVMLFEPNTDWESLAGPGKRYASLSRPEQLSRMDIDAAAQLYPTAATQRQEAGTMTAENGERCLSINPDDAGNTRVFMAKCSGSLAQSWWKSRDGRFYSEARPGFCLSAPPGPLRKFGSVTVVAKCSAEVSQHWKTDHGELESVAYPGHKARYPKAISLKFTNFSEDANALPGVYRSQFLWRQTAR